MYLHTKLLAILNPLLIVRFEKTFAKKDLPEKHRIIEPGMMVTKDFDENR
jgi:hypothetical protein